MKIHAGYEISYECPQPTPIRVRVAGLCGIDHEAGLFFGDHVHARAGRNRQATECSRAA